MTHEIFKALLFLSNAAFCVAVALWLAGAWREKHHLPHHKRFSHAAYVLLCAGLASGLAVSAYHIWFEVPCGGSGF